ncbi:hypothetical protein LCGC14_1149770 [marine sediment metagenome]|uniref:Uncharacterized protein n=1 Tax=marine sediment metagenome TaxID=412755 RepID=A0A0F9M0R1_9ZZZZ
MDKVSLKKLLKSKGAKKRKSHEIMKVYSDLNPATNLHTLKHQQDGLRVLLWTLGLSIKDADFYSRFISKNGRLPLKYMR